MGRAVLAALLVCLLGGCGSRSSKPEPEADRTNEVVAGLNRWATAVNAVTERLAWRQRFVKQTNVYVRKTGESDSKVLRRRLGRLARVERGIEAAAERLRTEVERAGALVADLPQGHKLKVEVIAAGDAYRRWTSRLINRKTVDVGGPRVWDFGPDGTDRKLTDLGATALSHHRAAYRAAGVEPRAAGG
jgi:hypothetical protein